MSRRCNLSANYHLFSALCGGVWNVISGCMICLCCLAVFPAFAVGADAFTNEVLTNEENPYILIETEDEYSIRGIREDTFEYAMGSTSDCYVVVGSNNEYVFYWSNKTPPEDITGYPETGLYTNDAQNTPIYMCPNALREGDAIIKKDGSEVWFIKKSALLEDISLNEESVVIKQYLNGELNHMVTLGDLRLNKSDMQPWEGEYQRWRQEYHFSSDTIQITAPSGKQRVIDRQSGSVSFPESELAAEAQHHTAHVIGLIAVCSVVLVLMMIFVFYKRKRKQTTPNF